MARKKPRNVNYKADLLADLRDDVEFAAEYLSAAHADSHGAFLVALGVKATTIRGKDTALLMSSKRFPSL